MASGCGSWGQVATQMGLPEYLAMHRQWRRHPPVHLMVAAYLGIKPPPDENDNEAALEELLSFFGVADGGTAQI